jgi:integrase/recombinase XerD
MPQLARPTEFSLHSTDGQRKYLNRHERHRALAEMVTLPIRKALFCLTLAWTGARVSEILALTPSSFQIEARRVSIATLKRRKPHVREVPIPPWLMDQLAQHFALARRQRFPETTRRRLWRWHRATGWRITKRVMARAGVFGCMACPKGLRHGFGVGTLQAGVPLNLTQKWMGHARMSTTAIYVDASGPEEDAFAARFWGEGAATVVDQAKAHAHGRL